MVCAGVKTVICTDRNSEHAKISGFMLASWCMTTCLTYVKLIFLISGKELMNILHDVGLELSV